MADFQEARFKCRVHPPVGSAVECDFDETLVEVVYDNLRSFVRVTGEAEEDPDMKRIKRLKIVDIEPLEVETEAQPISPDEFWRSPTLEELAAEQGIKAPQRLDGTSSVPLRTCGTTTGTPKLSWQRSTSAAVRDASASSADVEHRRPRHQRRFVPDARALVVRSLQASP